MFRFVRDNTFLDSEEKPKFILYLIILNRPLNKEMLIDIYQKSTYVICADGGTNRLY